MTGLIMGRYSYVCFFLLLLINCKDPIDLRGKGSIGLLVIDGKITTLPGPYELRLGYTVGVDQKPSPVSHAHAKLFDDAGNSEAYDETGEAGVYSAPGAIVQGIPGRAYHIEVTLEDGRKYTSKPEIIPLASGIDTPSYDFGTRSEFVGDAEVKKNVINVYTDTQLPADGKDIYMRWYATETYMFEQAPKFDEFTGTIPKPCYVDGFADRQRITLFTTRSQQLQTLTHTLVAVRDIDHSFLARHYFTVYLSSITKESHEYWKNVDQLINRSGSIFDTPPAPIAGNIFSPTDETEKVLGYFEAANTSYSRLFVLRKDVPFQMLSYCNDPKYGPYWPFYPKECNDCLLLENSSKTPPDWWVAD